MPISANLNFFNLDNFLNFLNIIYIKLHNFNKDLIKTFIPPLEA